MHLGQGQLHWRARILEQALHRAQTAGPFLKGQRARGIEFNGGMFLPQPAQPHERAQPFAPTQLQHRGGPLPAVFTVKGRLVDQSAAF